MRNVKLGRQVLNYVVANPPEFSMATYGSRYYPYRTVCRTVACLAGHTLLFSGYTLDQESYFLDPDDNRVPTFAIAGVASNLLGLTDEEFCGPGDKRSLFSGGQTDSDAIERFRVIVEKSEAEGVSHLPAPWPL